MSYPASPAISTLDPGDDPALRSLYAEGVKSLAWTSAGLLRRVLAAATSPGFSG